MSEADQLGIADFPQAAAQSLAMPEAGHAPGEPLVIGSRLSFDRAGHDFG